MSTSNADSPKPALADGRDDLKTLPIAELEKKLDSTPEGPSDAGAKKRRTQNWPKAIE